MPLSGLTLGLSPDTYDAATMQGVSGTRQQRQSQVESCKEIKASRQEFESMFGEGCGGGGWAVGTQPGVATAFSPAAHRKHERRSSSTKSLTLRSVSSSSEEKPLMLALKWLQSSATLLDAPLGGSNRGGSVPRRVQIGAPQWVPSVPRKAASAAFRGSVCLPSDPL